jgi:hypothetical protein
MTNPCQTPAPVSGMGGGKGKGKGGRRMVAAQRRDAGFYDDMTIAFNSLSPNDKKRLLVAMEQDDVKMVDAIFEGVHSSARTLQRRGGIDNEPSPEDLFGVLGIFPSFCDSIIGSMTNACQTPAPVSGMGGGKGKGGRRMVAVERRNDEAHEHISDAFNALSSKDKKRLLDAIQQSDAKIVDELLEIDHP